jgi:ubiquinone/menaquinone biosynthesis C-methylase UbiE
MDKYTKEYHKKEKVAEYLQTFKNKPDQVIHDLELDIINSVLTVASQRDTYLDVACGFGRIACAASRYFKESHAIDASPQMIALIRKRCPRVKARQMSADNLAFKSNAFDCVTAFRFIMNFERSQRLKMLKEIHRVLKPGGIFLCNVHLNKWSLRGIASQVRNRFQHLGQPYMSYRDAAQDLRRAGFRITELYGVKVMPFYRNRIFMPRLPLFWMERMLGRSPVLKRLADGYVFVCTKGGR